MNSMYLANLNITFGANDESLLSWLDDFIIPALQSGIKREIKRKDKTRPTYVMFDEVKLEYIDAKEKELVLRGIIIKDTILDIYNQYDEKEGLISDEKHPKSAPYSSFVIYLKNHRMVLVRNQLGSPDLRLFASTISEILKKYRKQVNKKRREEKRRNLLPNPIVSVNGIVNGTTIEEFLKSVKRVRSVTLMIKPRNNENGGLDGLIDSIDEQIRKTSRSKNIKVIISSPESIPGISKIIEETDGVVSTEIEVDYDDEYDEKGNRLKRKCKFRDNEIAQRMEINVPGELKDSFNIIYRECRDISSLQIETENIIDYNNYLKRREVDE